jgi:hypothetical protein
LRQLVHAEAMTRALAALVLLGCVLVPLARASEVDPSRLVLASADLPRAIALDRRESGLRTNAREGRDGREARELIARSGRITGYERTWQGGTITLGSRADLCRRPAGARLLYDVVREEMTKGGIKGLRDAPAGVGAESRIYTGAVPAAFTLVVWRYDRVFSGVVAVGLTKSQTLALARKQQRRIAVALA